MVFRLWLCFNKWYFGCIYNTKGFLNFHLEINFHPRNKSITSLGSFCLICLFLILKYPHNELEPLGTFLCVPFLEFLFLLEFLNRFRRTNETRISKLALLPSLFDFCKSFALNLSISKIINFEYSVGILIYDHQQIFLKV